jgi:hypothetical protein
MYRHCYYWGMNEFLWTLPETRPADALNCYMLVTEGSHIVQILAYVTRIASVELHQLKRDV